MDKKRIILVTMLSICMCGVEISPAGAVIASGFVTGSRYNNPESKQKSSGSSKPDKISLIISMLIFGLGGIIEFFPRLAFRSIMFLGESPFQSGNFAVKRAQRLWDWKYSASDQEKQKTFDKLQTTAVEIKKILDSVTGLEDKTISSEDYVDNFLCTDEFKTPDKKIKEAKFYTDLDPGYPDLNAGYIQGTDNIGKFQNLMSFISSCFVLRDGLVGTDKLAELDDKLAELHVEINELLQEKMLGKKKMSSKSWLSRAKSALSSISSSKASQPSTSSQPETEAESASEAETIEAEAQAQAALKGALDTSNMTDAEVKEEQKAAQDEKTEQIAKFKELLSKDSYKALFKIKSSLFELMNLLFGRSIFMQKNKYGGIKSRYSIKNFARAGILVPLYKKLQEIDPDKWSEKKEEFKNRIRNMTTEKEADALFKEFIESARYENIYQQAVFKKENTYETPPNLEELFDKKNWKNEKVSDLTYKKDFLNTEIIPLEDDIYEVVSQYNESVSKYFNNEEVKKYTDKDNLPKEARTYLWNAIKNNFNGKIKSIKLITNPTPEQEEQVNELFKEVLPYLAFVSDLGIDVGSDKKKKEVEGRNFSEQDFANKSFKEKVEDIEQIIGFLFQILDSQTTFDGLQKYLDNPVFKNMYWSFLQPDLEKMHRNR